MPSINVDIVETLRQKLGDIRARESLGFLGDGETEAYLEQLALFSISHVESHLNRKIAGTGLATVRKFDGNGRCALYIDDFTEPTLVRVDTNGDGTYDTTLTVDTHVYALPDNDAVAKTFLEIQPMRGAPIGYFPRYRRAVEVTAKFGWPYLPGAAADAILLIAEQRFQRDQQNRSGRLIASGEFDVRVNTGAIITPEVERMLAPYRHLVVG